MALRKRWASFVRSSGIEGAKNLVLKRLLRGFRLVQRFAALLGHRDDVSPTIGGIATALHEACRLQVVQQHDAVVRVNAETFSELLLGGLVDSREGTTAPQVPSTSDREVPECSVRLMSRDSCVSRQDRSGGRIFLHGN